ncbi:alpha/beta fold hydrolase [Streptomyces sp. NPDC046881]|uniref:thioesterase II family protein n=1 Tax=Streptomyces sp. NPDC046881 TaxID=3155374 RepID=UPI0033D93B7A
MSAQTVEPGTWLRRFHSAPPDAPLLVVLPHAGGSASHYQAFSGRLAGRAEVLAVQYPGRQDRYREEPVADLPTLARRVARALEPLADRRIALFGHSMGALVAFETALLLERENRGPAALFVSARRAPVGPPRERVHLRDDAGLLAELRALGGTDERLLAEEELLRLYLPVVRADYRALETYRCEPGAAVGCPVTGLAGDADPRVAVDDVAAWSRHTTNRFDLRVFSGGHFYLDQRGAEVADVVAGVLAGAAQTRERR